MQKYDLKYHKKPRRSLDETLIGPILRLLCALLGAALVIALIVFVAIPGVVRLFGGTLTRAEVQEQEPSPTPSPTAAPTPEPRWLGEAARIESKTLGGLPMLDSSIYGGRILYVSGTDPLKPDRLYAYDIAADSCTRLNATCTHGMLLSPVENADYLLYADVSPEGAGELHLREKATGADSVLCSLRYGAPQISLSGSWLCYTARIGESTAELYLVNLITKQGIAIARYTGTRFGTSDASLFGGALAYAEENGEGSSLVLLHPANGTKTQTDISGLVHDPKRGSGFVAYLDAPYGENASLYVRTDGEISADVASGVAAYYAAGAYVVYQAGGEVYAYHPASGTSFALTGGEGSNRLLTAGDGYALILSENTYQLMRLEHGDGEG